MRARRIERALEYAIQYGGIGGAHHKDWVIDQMVRALTNCPIITETAKDCEGNDYQYESQGESQEYIDLVDDAKDGEEGPNTYDWEVGIAP